MKKMAIKRAIITLPERGPDFLSTAQGGHLSLFGGYYILEGWFMDDCVIHGVGGLGERVVE